MLERVQITNFQSIVKCDVTLGPLTTIVGPSDKGKSAFFRALRWIVLNKPQGDAFIRHNQKRARVRLKVDGITIERARTASSNTYKVAGKTLRAFKRDVPPRVTRLVKMTDVNFQQQHDAPFWLALTPSALGDELNELAGLEDYDVAIDALATLKRKTKAELDVVIKRRNNERARWVRLKWTEDALSDFASLEHQREALDAEGACLASLKRLSSEYANTLEVELPKAIEEIRSLVANAAKLQKQRQHLKQLTSLLSQLNDIGARSCENKKRRRAIQKELEQVRKCPACGQPLT